MLTQCPNCQTTFRVTSEILRVAQGQVRCGRCHTQFDALERLIDEEAVSEITTGPRQAPAESPSAIEVEEPAAHEEITLEGKHIEITGTYLVMDESQQGEPQLRQEVTEEWVEIGDPDDELDVQLPAASAEAFVEEPAGDHVSAVADLAPDSFETSPSSQVDTAADLDLLIPQQRRGSAWIWKILLVPLALLLVAQVIHHYRAELARHPRLGAAVVDAYNALGLTLTPDWNLHAYEIQHWAVVPDAATGTLNLRASVTNQERFAQPYPLLKLVLEDRWGETVRERAFEPAEYLDAGTATDRLLAPAQRANVAIAIVDPGPEAAGFHFEACLRGRNGVVCASEVPE